MRSNGSRPPIAEALRRWRQRRNLSQLALAHRANVSPRHLSFIEIGRAHPSREMVLHLARHLMVPLQEQNELLVAAGYAPEYSALAWDSEEFASIRGAVDQVLTGFGSSPAIVVDHNWNLLAANAAAAILSEGVDRDLLERPMNVLRTCLHPRGLARRIHNIDEWARHVLGNLDRQLALAPSPSLQALRDELASYVEASAGVEQPRGARLAVPLHLTTDEGDVRLLATIATFGTALDVTLAGLTIEAFLPADDVTAAILTKRHASRSRDAQVADHP